MLQDTTCKSPALLTRQLTKAENNSIDIISRKQPMSHTTSIKSYCLYDNNIDYDKSRIASSQYISKSDTTFNNLYSSVKNKIFQNPKLGYDVTVF